MIGELITSTLLKLFVVPVVYTLLDDFANCLRRGRSSRLRVVHTGPVVPRYGARRGGLRAEGSRGSDEAARPTGLCWRSKAVPVWIANSFCIQRVHASKHAAIPHYSFVPPSGRQLLPELPKCSLHL